MTDALLISTEILIFGPIPLFHFLLHGFLPFWKKYPLWAYLVAFIIWTLMIIPALKIGAINNLIFIAPFWLVSIGYILIFISIIIIGLAIISLGPKRFFMLAMLRPEAVSQKIIINGLYRLLPHPAYTAYMCIAAAVFLITGQLTSLLFLIYAVILFLTVINLETKELRQRLRITL